VIARILNRIAAARLSKRGHQQAHARIIERTKEMREQLGLPRDRRLV
jgi:hypothetical protein